MVTEEMVKAAEAHAEDLVHSALETIIPQVKQEILEQKKKSLENKGVNDWDQTPFPDLKPSTIRRKKNYSKPDNPLYRTGDLSESLYVNDDPNDLDVHSSLEYVPYVKAWEKLRNSSHPFEELTDQEYNSVLDEIEKRLQDAFSQ